MHCHDFIQSVLVGAAHGEHLGFFNYCFVGAICLCSGHRKVAPPIDDRAKSAQSCDSGCASFALGADFFANGERERWHAADISTCAPACETVG